MPLKSLLSILTTPKTPSTTSMRNTQGNHGHRTTSTSGLRLTGVRHVKEESNVTVLAQLHIWHKSRTLPGSSICTVACLLCHCLVALLAQVTHRAGKFHLHCCLFALPLPCCTSGTSHAPCREVPSALLPVCSAVSPAYKNFSCSPSFFSSSFLFSFLVFRLVHQSKSQVSSQVRSRLLNQLGSSSALPLPCHMPSPSGYLWSLSLLLWLGGW